MAQLATIDRRFEGYSEEKEHEDQISNNYRRLLEPNGVDNYSYGASSNPTAPIYGTTEVDYPQSSQRAAYRADYERRIHEPVVPSSPEAPSAAQRLSDYVPIHRGMTSFTRIGDMQAEQMPAASVVAPAKDGKHVLFEGLAYQNGELVDLNAPVAPVVDSSYMMKGMIDDVVSNAPMQTVETVDEDDARPTPATLSVLNGYKSAEMMVEQPAKSTHSKVGFFASLSLQAKIALVSVVAVVAVMITLICVNTAILSSLQEGIANRHEQVQILEEQISDIQNEIGEITSPENIADWAISNGLVPQA